MGSKARSDCLEKVQRRYQSAKRRGKKVILDEFCATWSYNRKYAIDLLNGRSIKGQGLRGRPPRYGNDEHAVLERIWLIANRPCWKPGFRSTRNNTGN